MLLVPPLAPLEVFWPSIVPPPISIAAPPILPTPTLVPSMVFVITPPGINSTTRPIPLPYVDPLPPRFATADWPPSVRQPRLIVAALPASPRAMIELPRVGCCRCCACDDH